MIEIHLSREIEMGAKARPRYSTDVIPTDGGFEWRNECWTYPKFEFEFNVEPGNSESDEADLYAEQTLAEFIDLFHIIGGKAESFLFRHWADYRAIGQLIATGDGSTTQFQLYRVYTRGAFSRRRKITRPDAASIVVYVDGVVTSATIFTLGRITLASPPANGAQITADFEFDLPVRFDSDELELVALNSDLDQAVNITLLEVREEA